MKVHKLELIVLLSVLFSVGHASAATYTVTNAADVNYGDTLRWALNSAKLGGIVDTIAFNLPAPYKISPTGELPRVDTFPGTIIDGTTQPGYAGTPLVHICGTGAPAWAQGLYINSDSNTVKGLIISGYPNIGIYIDQGDSNVVQGCHLLSNDLAGVWIYDGDYNRIGGTVTNAGNVIGGGTHGIYLEGGSVRTVIQGNLFGTDPAGTARYGFDEYGIHLFDSINTQIGGTNALARNVISGAGRDGITTGSGAGGGHVIEGNLIGTDILGTSPISNLWGGISIGVPNCRIGGSNSATRNVISGNREGFRVVGTNAHHTRITGNYIGVDISGTQALGNNAGILVNNGANQCEIGNSAAGGGNVISGNRQSGIYFYQNCFDNQIVNNLVGTDASGTNALGNQTVGIQISNCGAHTIGGNSSTRNIIADNQSSGIVVEHSTGVVIRANYVGMGSNLAPMGNSNYGVRLRYAQDFDVGGTLGLHGNIIGNSGLEGVSVGESTNGYIRKNFIGWTGSAAASNAMNGVYITGSAHLQVLANTIGASGEDGVSIVSSRHITLQNNDIGTDSLGVQGLGNAGHGVYITFYSVSNVVGGTDGISGNVISGNGGSGVFLNESTVLHTLIAGNKIGTDPSGTTLLPNRDGIGISSSSFTTIGGTNGLAGNLISGNDGVGILVGGNSYSNTVQGNIIGADAAGTAALPNAEHGIRLSTGTSNNLIGGVGEYDGNLIAFNRDRGVLLYDAGANTTVGNTILGNRIMRNESLGIDLGYNGVTGNDPQDPDVGENRLQNFPVLLSATNNGAQITVEGYLDSVPSSTFVVELFGSRDPDLTGYGEGEFLMGRTNVVTPVGGMVGFTSVVSVAAGTPNFITATATALASGDTSEFSRRLLLDSDGDGMGDGYEDEYFGSHTGGDPTAHSDADGVNDLGEFLAETDPTDAASCLRITRIWREFDNWFFTINASDTRDYRYQLNRDLGGNPAFNWWDWGSGPYSRTNGVVTLRDGSSVTTNVTSYRVHAMIP